MSQQWNECVSCGKYNEVTALLCRYCNAILPATKNVLSDPGDGDGKVIKRKTTRTGRGRYLTYVVTYVIFLAGGIVLLRVLMNLIEAISKLAKALKYQV